MISSASSSDRANRADALMASGPVTARPATPRPDQISTESAEFLRAALTRHPAIRPEMVSRGQALAADPGYPSMEILTRVAQKIVAAPDLTEDEA